MAKALTGLGHVEIEIVESRDALFRRRWHWRTRYVRNGEIGIRSETYSRQVDVERSIRAHRRYISNAPVKVRTLDGRVEALAKWAE